MKYRCSVSVGSMVASVIACACACATAVWFLDAIDAAFGTLLAAAALFIAAVDLERFKIQKSQASRCSCWDLAGLRRGVLISMPLPKLS